MPQPNSSRPAPAAGSGAARFLIVDDSRAIQAIIRRAIEDGGYLAPDIRTAEDGEAALDLLASFHPDLVITDWHMPRVSGLEMLQAMRQMGAADLKVGFVTTESSQRMLDEARTNGAVFILNKPFRDEQLLAEVTAAVPHGRGAAAAAAVPVAPQRPLPTESARDLIGRTLGGAGFELMPAPALAAADLGDGNLLGLYSAPGKPVAAVGVLDAAAVALLGGGAAGLAPAAWRAALQSGAPAEALVAQAAGFLRSAGALLQTRYGEQACNLARTMTVPGEFPKLQEMLSRREGRSDFLIELPELGGGRLSFVAL